MDPRFQDRPVLDMTPEGEFRGPAPRPATWLDRLLMRLGGAAALVAIVALGIVVAGIAVAFFALALPVALVAGLVAFGSLWWRARRNGRSFRMSAVMMRR
ncbi:hypothetical protein CR162_00410 [Pseudoroseomonas rhizosphaerae]|uniref:Uncharacterized protein n=1 Tax=Teichococcus rhizosphaerae TaxID=1335062 RepID=A0A2C6ZEH9_9PROT|nr:hypothetical protein [Pseudoroseomonas rhizosphaerae]PHK96871.1 hypothetical protein CR162_00410 [Pseudoroseomonas rhizosphaerae]